MTIFLSANVSDISTAFDVLRRCLPRRSMRRLEPLGSSCVTVLGGDGLLVLDDTLVAPRVQAAFGFVELPLKALHKTP